MNTDLYCYECGENSVKQLSAAGDLYYRCENCGYESAAAKVPKPYRDRLDTMFELQKNLMRKYGVLPEQIRLQGRGAKSILFIKIGYACIREVIEIVDETPWKWWRPMGKKPDVEKIKNEVVDLLHFCLEFAVLCAFDAESLYNRYVFKNSINHDRITESTSDTEDDW